jgi:hypothetical protein
MSVAAQTQHRQQILYWNALVQMKVACAYIRRYRGRQKKWVTALAVLRAIASSGGIAGWAIWHELSFVWGAIIAASQVADALSGVFPFAKKHKSATKHTVTLDALFIDAQLEWEAIFAGRVSDTEIANRVYRLRKAVNDAEIKHFPDGLEVDHDLFDLAQSDAQA